MYSYLALPLTDNLSFEISLSIHSPIDLTIILNYLIVRLYSIHIDLELWHTDYRQTLGKRQWSVFLMPYLQRWKIPLIILGKPFIDLGELFTCSARFLRDHSSISPLITSKKIRKHTSSAQLLPGAQKIFSASYF